MWPSFCAIKRGAKARTPWITPHRLTPRIQRQSSTEFSHAVPLSATPALLQTRCTSFTLAANASTCSPFETSTRIALALVPFFSINSLVAARPLSSTSASARCMPSSAKASAMARPRPLAAPVTTAVLPFSGVILRALLVLGQPLASLAPQRVAESLAEETEVTDAPRADLGWGDAAQLGFRGGQEAPPRLPPPGPAQRLPPAPLGPDRPPETPRAHP